MLTIKDQSSSSIMSLVTAVLQASAKKLRVRGQLEEPAPVLPLSTARGSSDSLSGVSFFLDMG